MKINLLASTVLASIVLCCGFAAADVTSGGALASKKQETENFVQQAVDFANAHGKEAALAEFMKKGGAFHRGELYIFAYDFSGTVISHGGRPELVGKNLIQMQDPNGVQVIAELIRLAKSGQGWLTYLWPNPAQANRLQTKLSYVKKIDETWFVGSGLYTGSAENTPQRRVEGLEWLQMTPGDRLEILVKSMAFLVERGHTPGQTINEYYDAVSEKIRLNPSLYQEDITSILETVLQEAGQ